SDGATVMSYEQEIIDEIDPKHMSAHMNAKAGGHLLPGWEPERMARVKELFDLYRDIDDTALLANMKYFLEAIMPVCSKYNIKMAMHPDDPAWPVFGLPRVMSNKEQILRILKMVDNPLNGITLCTGSLGSDPNN
ncbi:mannonate dehydratase, partial [Treponema sp. R6D11]